MRRRQPPSHVSSEVLARSNYRCFYCGEKFNNDNPPTIDHIVPVIAGGSNRLSNLVTACLKCNRQKGHKYIGEYFQSRQRLELAVKTYLELNNFEWQVLKIARKIRKIAEKINDFLDPYPITIGIVAHLLLLCTAAYVLIVG